MRLRRAAGAALPLGCVALAGLSLLLSARPHYDAWGWLVWGREVVDPGLELHTVGGPAWKPGPVLFTALFAPLGSAAPALWLLVVRAGGLLALAAAFRLGRRIAGVGAGVLAVVLLALVQSWPLDLAWGEAEPLLVAAVLWAVERHLAGRHRVALGLGLAAALVRPEAWPFLGLYAVWAWHRRAAPRWLVALVLLVVPVLWFGPDWYSTGDPFTGSRLAKAGAEARAAQSSSSPVLDALGRIGSVLSLPVWLAALTAVGFAVRRRTVLPLALAAGSLAWIALVAAMTLVGYAGLGRFALPATALACVLAGAGASWVLRAVRPRAAVVAVAIALAAAAAPFELRSLHAAVADARAGSGGRPIVAALEEAIRGAGGRARLRALGRPVINGPLETTLAWELGVPLRDVSDHAREGRSVVFAASYSRYSGPPPRLGRAPASRRVLAVFAPWTVVLIVTPRRPARR